MTDVATNNSNVSANANTNVNTNVNTDSSTVNANANTDVNVNTTDAQTSNNNDADLNSFADNFNNSDIDNTNDVTNEPVNVVPDSYQLEMLQGQELSEQEQANVQKLFKDVKLTQEQASQLFNAWQQSNLDNSNQFNTDNEQAMYEQKLAWYQSVVNDPILGGENLQQTKANLKKVMSTYGSQELSQFLNQSGLGFNPSFVKFCNTVASRLNSDNQFIGGNASNNPSISDRLKSIYDKSSEMNFN